MAQLRNRAADAFGHRGYNRGYNAVLNILKALTVKREHILDLDCILVGGLAAVGREPRGKGKNI